MASNLNKAFIRAYAKDRQATPEPATTAQPTAHASPMQPSATRQPTAAQAWSAPPMPQPRIHTQSAGAQSAGVQPQNPQSRVVQSRVVQPQVAQSQAPQSGVYQSRVTQSRVAQQPATASVPADFAPVPSGMEPNTPPNNRPMIQPTVQVTRVRTTAPSSVTAVPRSSQPAASPTVPPAFSQTVPPVAPHQVQPTVQPVVSSTAPSGMQRMTRPAPSPAPAPAKPAPAKPVASLPTHQPASAQPVAFQPSSTHAQPQPQPAPIHRPLPRAAASPVPTSAPVAAVGTPTADPSTVWRRIDEAHGAQSRHPLNDNPRPAAMVGAAPIAAPKRKQAAAVPAAPVERTLPAPMPAPTNVPMPGEVAAPELPLLADQFQQVTDSQVADTRRRTVADFLYAAGQYSPGRILASRDATDSLAATGRMADTAALAEMQTTDSSMSMDSYAATNFETAGYEATAAVAPLSQPRVDTLGYVPAESRPVDEAPMPRRMGQILRVDIPRGVTHGQSESIAASANVMASQTNQASAQPKEQLAPPTLPSHPPVSVSSGSPATMAAMSSAAMSPAASDGMSGAMPTSGRASVSSPAAGAASGMEAPVARYVIEHRRLDRAHKINEAEEKLRRDTHKIFNPVWEVDTLQWPAVVDKLMQQRAESMAYVAEHLKSACQEGLSVLGVSSAGKGEGRTTVASCLARLAAVHGLNVALVDLDLDHPTLCIQTNMEVEHDWRDCFMEDISLEEVAVHSIEDQLTILPLKPRGGRPGLLASDSRIAEMLDELSKSFELVVVDCAPANSSGNVITGLAHTHIFDAAIVVVDRRDSHQDRVEDAVRLIQQTGIESIGIVDNFSM
ncbi:MAG: P-loop NTPase [Pirellulaceae bacterium]|nr:P-loop NTPase [Pirellulaceae bacterium]